MSHLEQGDIISIDFNPPAGHELAKSRLAVVVTVFAFNSRSSLVGVIPLQSANSGYPLHVPVQSAGMHGFACVEMLRTMDVDHCGYRLLGHAAASEMQSIMGLLKGMFGF